MTNLENNNEKEQKKSIAKNIGNSVQKGIDKVQKNVESATELANSAINHPVETAGEFLNQASKDVVSIKWWARLLQVLFWAVLTLVITFVIAVNLPITKNWAAQKVITKLNDQLKSHIAFDSIDVNYFGDVTLFNVSVKDYRNYPFLRAKKLYADSNWFAIIGNSRNMQFQSMSLDKLDLKVITYKGDSISNFIRFVDLFDTGKPSVKKEPFQLKTRIYITNSKILISNQNSQGEAGKWLNATNLNLTVPELRIRDSDVFAQINNVRFITERWGKKHVVETFSTDLTLNKKFLYLKDLTFNTDHSLLQGDIKFNLNDGKWINFADKVQWNMNVKQGSQISGYDIGYFVTNWNNDKPFNIFGKMNGTLNNFILQDFLIHNPNVNIRTKKMKVKNILKPNFNIQTDQLSTDFRYVDLKYMMPTFISKKMKNFADDFGKLKFSGGVRITPKQVYVSNGNLLTGIGQAKIKEFYLEQYSSDVPKYGGYVEVNDLNTSVISKNKKIGLISGKFNIKGEGFDVNTMKLTTTSDISKIVVLDKEINDLHLDGSLDHKQYKGLISINDEHAKGMVNGLIDFNTSQIKADVKANIPYLNINHFTGNTGSQIFSGQLDGTISMTNLNDMNLDVQMKQVNFRNGIQNYAVNHGSVKVFFENGNRTVLADVPEIMRGKISGKFNLEDLVGMVQNGIGKVFVEPLPKKFYKGQWFTVDFKVQRGLVSYFIPEVQFTDGAIINGRYDGDSNNLILNVEVSKLLYLTTFKKKNSTVDEAMSNANLNYTINPRTLPSRDSVIVNNLVLHINTKNLSEQLFAKVDRAKYNQNILKDITLNGHNETGNLLHLTANFKYGKPQDETNGTLKEYTVKLNQSSNAQGDYVFRFEPTQLKFNNVVWNVDTSEYLDESITYHKETSDFLIKNLRIYSDNSEIFVKNLVFKSGEEFQVEGEVKNFDISKIFEMQENGNTNHIKGIANGSFNIAKLKNNLVPLIALDVNGIEMSNQKIGNLVTSIKTSDLPNIFDIDVKLMSSEILIGNNLSLTGTMDNNTGSPKLNMVAKLNDFDLSFIQQFVGAVFSNLRGKASGDLNISGTLDNVDYSGDIALKDVGLKLIFTGVDYVFNDTTILLSKGLAVLNNIGVKDERTNSNGSISGMIQFETLSSIGVNLVIRADNLLLLNTTQKDFDLFWGRIYGKGDLFIDGPVSALNISTPNMKSLNNSVFTFNSNSTSNVDEFKMLRFLQENDNGKITLEQKKKTGANMNINFVASVDKGTTVNVLVGDNIGNITVRGTANPLHFLMDRNGSIVMNGNYVVENGTFVSKAVLERTFQIVKGSNINWDGDPMTPDLNINANYMRTITNTGQYLNMGSLPPVNVVLTTKITQKLDNPKIELGVQAQDVSSQVREALAEKMNNEDEKLIQFGSILVLNSFNVTNSNSHYDIVGNTLENSGYNILFKQLGSVLNSISNQFQIDLSYLSGDVASNTSNRANASLCFALSPRITIKTGLGIPISKIENTSTNYLSSEGIIEYDWSKNNDGSKVLRAYSKPSNIGMSNVAGNASANQTYGIGVVYSKSFNKLFKTKQKFKKTKYEKNHILKDSIKSDTVK